MSKYQHLIDSLAKNGRGEMKCFGSSMKPILPNPSLCRYQKLADYDVGDIVFCKVRGRYIDAHKIVQKAADGSYLIANNHGHENGWTRQVYGKVVALVDGKGVAIKEF